MILKNATFNFIIGTVVKGEISESYDYSIIEEVIESYIESFSEVNYFLVLILIGYRIQ